MDQIPWLLFPKNNAVFYQAGKTALFLHRSIQLFLLCLNRFDSSIKRRCKGSSSRNLPFPIKTRAQGFWLRKIHQPVFPRTLSQVFHCSFYAIQIGLIFSFLIDIPHKHGKNRPGLRIRQGGSGQTWEGPIPPTQSA